SAHRTGEVIVVEHRNAARRDRAGRRLLHAGAFLDGLQTHHRRDTGALAMRQQERIAVDAAITTGLEGSGAACRVSTSCKLENDLRPRKTPRASAANL